MVQCRGKRTDTKEWVEGYCFKKDEKVYIMELSETVLQRIYTEEPGIADFSLRAFEVIPEKYIWTTIKLTKEIFSKARQTVRLWFLG